ncbi:CIS tube protein [Brevibacillus dissolubilis]|uniref:CIS tube protein n=1 Tax=Brevibacillus dissolubilis TaxID=1844116 RepID=UPI0011172D94|nr:LysM peptidoglycan-binding domain-containing protein [Brevibacillus dissolubilis]
MGLVKAKIQAFTTPASDPIPVMFNPTQYQIETANQYAWHTVPGLASPVAQFITGEAETLSMELFFDTTATQSDVRDLTGTITGLLKINSHLHAPPLVQFTWGSFSFKGLIEKVSQTFTMFHESGNPVRARLNVTFKAYRSIQDQLSDISPESADRTKQRVLHEGEQLWMLAHTEYEDTGVWREIAKANGIDNPRLLQAGRQLTLPRLE